MTYFRTRRGPKGYTVAKAPNGVMVQVGSAPPATLDDAASAIDWVERNRKAMPGAALAVLALRQLERLETDALSLHKD